MSRPLLLLALLGLAAAGTPSWYKCDCSQRNNCMCPSLKAPGGLHKPPQFILLTHDDAILSTTNRAYRQVCDGRRNPNGCPFRATMFTQAVNTDCKLAKRMWEDGYEIATHTANHIQMPAGYPYSSTVAEILGARRYLSQECGIPADQIRGFRSPYLVTNPVVRQVLFENGFLFDSTLLETGDSESLSRSFAERTWPYTYDFGVAQNCDWFRDTQLCNATERWPGLWSVPMWVLQILGLEFTMDVGYYGGRGVYEPLKAAFDEVYNGNRAPLPIYLHTTWVDKDPDRVAELERFADYTATKGDVFWVTMSQLIEWMLDPKPASEMGREMCERRSYVPAPAPRLPQDGANITLSLPGATKAQVYDQADRLAAAVTKLLGPGASGAFVAAVSGGATDAPASEGAAGDALVVPQSAPIAQQPSGKALLKDGFMQFEGPTYLQASFFTQSAEGKAAKPSSSSSGGGGASVSARSMDAGAGAMGAASSEAAGSGSAAGEGAAAPAPPLEVVLAAEGAEPLALYLHANDTARQQALADELSAMGLKLQGQAALTPIQNGAAVVLAPPPAPSPAPQPRQAPAATAPDASTSAATSETVSSQPTASQAVATESSSSGSGSGGTANIGAIVGASVGAVALLALVAGGAVAYRSHRRRKASAPAYGVSNPTYAADSAKHEAEAAVSISVTAG